SEKLQKMMEWANIPDDMPIENKFISGAIESAQKKVEGHHFDIRKHLVEYDGVMNKHREIIYARRRKVLFHGDLQGEILEMLRREIEAIVDNNTAGREAHEWDLKEIMETVHAITEESRSAVTLPALEKLTDSTEMKMFLIDLITNIYEEKEKSLPDREMMREAERAVYLRTIDTLWMEHID